MDRTGRADRRVAGTAQRGLGPVQALLRRALVLRLLGAHRGAWLRAQPLRWAGTGLVAAGLLVVVPGSAGTAVEEPDAAMVPTDAGAGELTDAGIGDGGVDRLGTSQAGSPGQPASVPLGLGQSGAVEAEESAPEIAPLPAVQPGPAVAPIVESEQKQAPEARSIPTRERPGAVIKVILGLLALMALAYLGGDRRVLEWEKRLGVSQVITTGLPFILLGMVARRPSVGILTNPVLTELGPLLRIGLGSIGFVAGFRFEAKLFQGLPKGTSSVALISTLIPAAAVAAATAPLLLVFSNSTWSESVHNPVFLRDALILATAGAMTARSSVRLLDAAGSEDIPARILLTEELAGVLGLACVAAFFRQHGGDDGWHLPGTVWLLLTLGLGTALGLLFYTMLLTTRGPDFLAVTLGSVAFAAGAAGYWYLSSITVAFVAGVILANFPGSYQPRLREILQRIERPIYLLALVVIGALWKVNDWRGWVLMPVFMTTRLAGKWLAALIATRGKHLPITREESRALAISPIGALAIAIVVNAELLYPGGSIELIVSAVIGGGVLTEVFVQLAARRSLWRKRERAGTAQQDCPPSGTSGDGRTQEGPCP